MKAVSLVKQYISAERSEVVEGEVELLEGQVKSGESSVVNVDQLIMRRVETHQSH